MPYTSSTYTFNFTIERDGQEIKLTAEFDITLPIQGCAYTKNGDGFPDEPPECYIDKYSVFDVKGKVFWGERLTDEEIIAAESKAYQHALDTEFGKY